MGRYVILVEFQVEEGALAQFLELVTGNAASSLRDEPGCERFDVLLADGNAGRVLLYEIYRDRTAFDAHCRSPHFAVFDAAARPLVRDKRVTELCLIEASTVEAPPSG